VARIEWVQQRLENWALWHERNAGGGRGFAPQASFLSEVDSSRYRESHVPVDEVEAGVTNEGVASLKPDHEHLHRTLQLVYLADAGIKGTAKAVQRSESTVHAHLSQADALLAQWFTDRKRAREARRKSLEEARKSSTS
jgi:hypothetical protein